MNIGENKMNRYYLKGFAIYTLLIFTNLNAMEEQEKEEKAVGAPSATAMQNLFEYVRRGDISGVKRLMLGNFPLTLKDWLGQSLIHHAIISQQYNMLKFLLEIDKLNPNDPDHFGTTPLHLAVQLELPEMVEMLINSGKVDKTLKDSIGFTAKEYAEQLVKTKPIAHSFFGEGQKRSEESRIILGRKRILELLSK